MVDYWYSGSCANYETVSLNYYYLKMKKKSSNNNLHRKKIDGYYNWREEPHVNSILRTVHACYVFSVSLSLQSLKTAETTKKKCKKPSAKCLPMKSVGLNEKARKLFCR